MNVWQAVALFGLAAASISCGAGVLALGLRRSHLPKWERPARPAKPGYAEQVAALARAVNATVVAIGEALSPAVERAAAAVNRLAPLLAIPDDEAAEAAWLDVRRHVPRPPSRREFAAMLRASSRHGSVTHRLLADALIDAWDARRARASRWRRGWWRLLVASRRVTDGAAIVPGAMLATAKKTLLRWSGASDPTNGPRG